MELKWLEDFVSVAERKHFSLAAADRFITQSAISRRIQSLESWVGTDLIDRSHHPIRLTPAGEEYLKIARAMIGDAYEGRAQINQFSPISASGITMACLHTLTLYFLPNMLRALYDDLGKFSLQVLAEARSIEEYLTGLRNGTCDFFLCYANDAVSLNIDSDEFSYVDIDQQWARPYQGLNTDPIDFSSISKTPIDYLEYASTTYMMRVVSQTLANAPFRRRLNTLYRASLAESLLSATQAGIGIAWLPDTILAGPPEEQGIKLATSDWDIALKVRVYKLDRNVKEKVIEVWDHLNANNDSVELPSRLELPYSKRP